MRRILQFSAFGVIALLAMEQEVVEVFYCSRWPQPELDRTMRIEGIRDDTLYISPAVHRLQTIGIETGFGIFAVLIIGSCVWPEKRNHDAA